MNVLLRLSLLLHDWYRYPLPALWTWDAPGAACHLAPHRQGDAGPGAPHLSGPLPGSCRISGGTPPHPGLARQVRLPRDPHCSLLSSGQVQPQACHHPTLYSFPCPAKEAAGHSGRGRASSQPRDPPPAAASCLTQGPGSRAMRRRPWDSLIRVISHLLVGNLKISPKLHA